MIALDKNINNSSSGYSNTERYFDHLILKHNKKYEKYVMRDDVYITRVER